MGEMEERLMALERRIRQLEDEADIRRLMSTYQRLSDDSYIDEWAETWNDTMRTTQEDVTDGQIELFASSGPYWEGRGLNEAAFEGELSIHGDKTFEEFWRKRVRWMPRMVHHLTNEAIFADGDEAIGHWYSWESAIVLMDGEYVPVWIAGRFRIEFVREEPGWKIQKIRFEELFSSRADGAGWVAQPHLNYGPAALKKGAGETSTTP